MDPVAPYPGDYRPALAFSTVLYPLSYGFPLRETFPEEDLRDDNGLTEFLVGNTDGLGLDYRPEAQCPCAPMVQRSSRLRTILVQALCS